MSEARVLKDEIDVLYATSNRLTRALTPDDVLNAVVAYASSHGAISAQLFYVILGEKGEPEWLEIVAEWMSRERSGYFLGQRFSVLEFDKIKLHDTEAHTPKFVENILTSDIVNPFQRLSYAEEGIQSCILLPLMVKERWIGVIRINWTSPQVFDERDQRVYTALIQQTAPVVASMRLTDENQKRMVRAEHLLKINTALSVAVDELQILSALGLYVQALHANVITLSYLDINAREQTISRPVAVWENGKVGYFDSSVHLFFPPSQSQFYKLWQDYPNQVLLFENLETDPRIEAELRQQMIETLAARSLAILPLYSGGRYQGDITIHWLHLHIFSEEERYIFGAMLRTLPTIVASRRAYVAEQVARQETESLYRAGEAINAANSIGEIVSALTKLSLGSGGAVLMIFQGFDFDHTSYLDLFAVSNKSSSVATVRHTLDRLPALRNMPRHGVFVFEDVTTDVRADTVTRETLSEYGVQAGLCVSLSIGNRYMGVMSFYDTYPRNYTEQEKRLAAGVGDLVVAALERISLQVEKDTLHQRAETLAHMNAALLQAVDEVSILNAIAPYAQLQQADAMTLVYKNADEDNGIDFELIAVWLEGQTRSYSQVEPFPPVHPLSLEIDSLWMQAPTNVLFIENFLTDERLSKKNRLDWPGKRKSRAMAILPLYSGGRCQGALELIWYEPHVFTDEEKIVCHQLLQVVPSVVASRRAYLAEQIARQESELLYRASGAINAATTFDEIIKALAQIDADSRVISLNIWESYNYESAAGLEVKAAVRDKGGDLLLSDEYFPIEMFPIAHTLPRQGIWVIEDVMNDPQVDDVTRATWKRLSTAALIGYSLYRNDHWIGGFSLHSKSPRKYSEREKRLVAGIGDMVAAAVERIRLQVETEVSRQRAEQLAHINATLSQADDEWGILEAVSVYLNPLGSHILALHYTDLNHQGEIDATIMVAAWHDGKPFRDHPLLGVMLPQSYFPSSSIWTNSVEKITLVTDTQTDVRLQEATRSLLTGLNVRSILIIPLYSGGRWQGMITCEWTEPREITERERSLSEAFIQAVGAVVASRRAYLAEEQARLENEFLYRASQAINAAASYEEIAQAVALLHQNTLHVALGLWEDGNFDTAAYLEIVADTGSVICGQTRLSTKELPLLAMMSREHLLIVEDTFDLTQIDEVTSKTVRDYNIQSFAFMPLVIGQRFLGVLGFYSQTPRLYTSREKRLMGGIGDLVLAAVERMRLQVETEVARQRAETLAQVSTSLSQAHDEQSILAAVASLAEKYGAALSILLYTDAEKMDTINIVALRSSDGNSPLPLNFLPIASFPTENYPILHLAYSHPYEPVFVEDAAVDPRIASGKTQDFIRKVGWKAMILIPLRSAEQLQGILSFAWTEKQVFTSEMEALFRSIRPTATSVVTSRRTYLAEESARRESERRNQQLQTVAKVSAAAASRLDINELLHTVSELTRASFTEYHISIYLLDETDSQLVCNSSSRGTLIDAEQTIPLNSSRSLLARAGSLRQSIIVNDAGRTLEYDLMPMIPDMRSEMAVPMVVAERLIGVIDVQSWKMNRFAESDVWIMSTLADLFAVAVQNARLYAQAQVLAALEERTRLARELHDSVSQALYGIGLGARTARMLLDRDPSRLREPLDYVLSLAEAGLTEMRALIFELRPESLEQEGLITALTKQAASIQARHSIQVQTEFCDEPIFSVDVKEGLYRIAREALHNIVKHAQATQIQLALNQDTEGYILTIADNGVGFDTSAFYPGHLGLQSMQERTSRLNGTLHIESLPGKGTRILVRIPSQLKI